MNSPLQPLADYVVTVRESKTASGIYIPDNSEKPKATKVIAIGQEVKQVKVGDTILYRSFVSPEVYKDNNQEYVLVKEEDILAIVK